MRKFDYSWTRGPLPWDIEDLLNDIGTSHLEFSFDIYDHPEKYEPLKEQARFASAKYSNAIESIHAPDDRIQYVLNGGEPQNRDEEEIAGYGKALDVVEGMSRMDPVDDGLMLNLHSLLWAGEQDERGCYKDVDNVIAGYGPDGSMRIIFEPVPADGTSEYMKRLFEAIEIFDRGIEYDALLAIPCIILDYLCIHPFIDGNGRTSRLLTQILMYRSGLDVCRYSSLDERIYRDLGGYYRSLAASDRGWMDDDFSYLPFVRYFLKTLQQCFDDLDYPRESP